MTRKRAEKARQAATEQLSRAYDLLGEDMPEADVGGLLEAQVETVYEEPHRPTLTASKESSAITAWASDGHPAFLFPLLR